MIINPQYIAYSLLFFSNIDLSNYTKYSTDYYNKYRQLTTSTKEYKLNYTLEYNYLTTQKFIDEELSKYQDIIPE